MTERPLCKCHGEPMYWNRDVRKSKGGFWKCKVEHRAWHNRYRRENPDKVSARDARYYQANRLRIRAKQAEYKASLRGVIAQARGHLAEQQRGRSGVVDRLQAEVAVRLELRG